MATRVEERRGDAERRTRGGEKGRARDEAKGRRDGATGQRDSRLLRVLFLPLHISVTAYRFPGVAPSPHRLIARSPLLPSPRPSSPRLSRPPRSILLRLLDATADLLQEFLDRSFKLTIATC